MMMIREPMIYLTVTLTLLVCGLAGLWTYGPSQAEVQFVVPPQYEEQLNALDRAALEEAYRRHLRTLFLSWMKDSAGQPERALRGINKARRAYVESMTALDERAAKRRTPP